MSMAKKQYQKVKEPVRIRFKELANGNRSIYLDTYTDGKRQPKEFLRLYLIPERTPADRIQNRTTLEAATAIKAKRIEELTMGKAGINKHKGKILLSVWLEEYQKSLETKSRSLRSVTRRVGEMLLKYGGKDVRLCDVDKKFVQGFNNYLKNDCVQANGQKLSANTASIYSRIVVSILNVAFKRELIPSNPCWLLERSDKLTRAKTKRTYLTIEEVKTLMETECEMNKDVRSAFLFSCFCGLRLCDIKNLQWKHIKTVNKTPMVEIYQQKTSEPLYLPLSDAAVKNLPPRADREEFVFTLPSHGIVNKHIHRWTEAAGITDRNITVHTARHTFATLNLTAGVDLYTVSKLLGHTEIRTTQIYAEVVNSAKIEAVNKVSDIFKTKGGDNENK